MLTIFFKSSWTNIDRPFALYGSTLEIRNFILVICIHVIISEKRTFSIHQKCSLTQPPVYYKTNHITQKRTITHQWGLCLEVTCHYQTQRIHLGHKKIGWRWPSTFAIYGCYFIYLFIYYALINLKLNMHLEFLSNRVYPNSGGYTNFQCSRLHKKSNQWLDEVNSRSVFIDQFIH